MTALNSFSIARDLHGYLDEIIEVESSGRVMQDKGIFVIPYDVNRLVAFVRCEVDVLAATNESRTVWSNPEISFYGYCHIRRFKQSVGNPVQINQRNQILFQWFPQENLVFINDSRLLESFLIGLNVPFTDPYKIYLTSPWITDFSFGFPRSDKFSIVVTIGYFKRSAFPDPDVADILQDVPNPQEVIDTDPSGFKDLSSPNAIPTPPYRDDNADFGESTPGENPPVELPESQPFRIRYRASGNGFNIDPGFSSSSNGQPPISVQPGPFLRADNAYYGLVTYANGSEQLVYRFRFQTEEQNQQFLDSFEFLGYSYE